MIKISGAHLKLRFQFPRRWLVLRGVLLTTSVAAMWPRDKQGFGGESLDPVDPAHRLHLKITSPLQEWPQQLGSLGEFAESQARLDEPALKIDPNLTESSNLPALGDRLERRRAAAKVEDLFAATTWNPPPPRQVPQRPLLPPMPSLPPFPYAVAGRVEDADGPMIVFMKQNQDFVVRLGDTLEHAYRVEAIDAQAVTLTYLPLNLKQVVAITALQ